MTARRLDRAAAIGVALLFVLLVVVGGFAGSGGEAEEGSVESSEEGGRLAAFLLLQELGFEPEAWSEAPGLLPSGEHLLICARAPSSLQGRFSAGAWDEEETSTADDDEEDAAAGPLAAPDAAAQAAPPPRLPPFVLHDLERYADFVREGGTLVLPAGEATQAFLTETLALVELEEVGELAPGPTAEDASEDLIVAGGEELRYDRVPPGFAEPGRDAWVEELVLTRDGRLFALAVPVGAGRVVLLADDGFLDNPEKQGYEAVEPRGLAAADHALLLVRLVEELDRGGRVLFDEYALGRWVPDSAVDLAASGVRGILTLQLLLFLLVLAWRSSWVREFPRDPEGLASLSPLSRARAQAGLYGRAGRWDLVGGMLRRGVLRRLCALARMRSGRPGSRAGGEPALGPGAARGEREAWGRWAAGQVDALVRTVGDEQHRERYAELLLGAPPSSAAELDELASRLEELEDRVARLSGHHEGREPAAPGSVKVPGAA